MALPGLRGQGPGRVHGYHERTAADVPADGRRVVVSGCGVRRMRCPDPVQPAADLPGAGPGVYRPTLVDPYRDHLRKRRADGIPVRQLLREIRELGYQGSSNLLVRYIDQGPARGRPAAPVTPPGHPDPAHKAAA